MNIRNLFKYLALPFILLLLVGCEPISVSINSRGEIAFARGEGVFFVNIKEKTLSTLFWNYGSSELPILVRWSADERGLAYTIKDEDSETKIFMVDRSGKNRVELYSTPKIITQLEWAPGGDFITFAQQGKDTNLNVADLGIIEVKTKRSSLFVESAGDLHRWVDAATLVFMKINEKNPDNTNMYKGALSRYDVKKSSTESLLPVIIDKNGGFDSNDKQVIFTAYAVTDRKFGDDLTDSFPFSYYFGAEGADQLAKLPAFFLKFSPDNKQIAAIVEDNYDKKLAVFDLKSGKMSIILPKIADKVSANSSEITVYPAWYGNEGIVYFQQSNVYGSNGQALQLRMVDLKSKKLDNLQPIIDSLVDEEVRDRGGY